MADVRALLKAKREEVRITHPLATYNKAGQLKCTVCGTIIKHASAWEGHVGSKAHRTAVTRLKEEERIRAEQRQREEQEEQERISRGKRKAEEDVDEDSDSDEENGAKKPRLTAPSSFPGDFFSDSSRTIPMGGEDDDNDEPQPVQPSPAVPTASATKSQIDLEFERFQREVINAPDHRETYENATIMAEPVLADDVNEGFPVKEDEEMADATTTRADEEEERRKREEDDRELIMDRLLEEERAQEDADMRATVMKNKIDALKKRREAAKKAKS
jgi:zinc finger protein 830